MFQNFVAAAKEIGWHDPRASGSHPPLDINKGRAIVALPPKIICPGEDGERPRFAEYFQEGGGQAASQAGSRSLGDEKVLPPQIIEMEASRFDEPVMLRPEPPDI